MTAFMQRIKALREEKNLSLRQLAQLTNISHSSISAYEKGRREPSFDSLEALSDVFNCDIDYLLGRTDIRNKEANNLGYNSLYEAYKENSPEEPKLTEGEKMWLDLYHLLSDESKATITNTMTTIKALPEEKQALAAQSFLHLLSSLQ